MIISCRCSERPSLPVSFFCQPKKIIRILIPENYQSSKFRLTAKNLSPTEKKNRWTENGIEFLPGLLFSDGNH
jgi:hypothetical protein